MTMPVMLIQHELIAQERSLDVISTVGQWRVQMNGGFLQGTVNGGAWMPFVFAPGGVVSMQNAYDGGGAVGSGLGRSLVTMNGGAVVMTNSGANANNVLELTKAPAAGQLGAALTVTMGVNATFGPGIAVSVASSASPGITVTHLAAANSDAFSASMSGWGSGFTMLRVDNNNGVGSAGFNYGDQAAGTNGARNMPALYMNVTPNFTANGSLAGALNRFRLAATSQGGGTTLTLGQPIVSIEHAPASIAGGLFTDTTTGLSITMTPVSAANVVGQITTISSTGGTGSYAGRFIQQGNGFALTAEYTSNPAMFSDGAVLFVQRTCAALGGAEAVSCALFWYNPSATVSRTSSSSVIDIRSAPDINGVAQTLTLNGSLLNITHIPTITAGAITDTTIGLAIAMTPAAASAVTGASITMSATATGAGLLITHNRATAAAGTVALRLTGADEAVCVEMTDGDTVGVSAANEGRLRYNATTQTWQVSANTGAFANIAVGAAGVTLDGAYDFGGAGAGRAITVDSGAVTLTNAVVDASNALEITRAVGTGNAIDITKGTNTGHGVDIDGAWAGNAGIFVQNTAVACGPGEASMLYCLRFGAGVTGDTIPMVQVIQGSDTLLANSTWATPLVHIIQQITQSGAAQTANISNALLHVQSQSVRGAGVLNDNPVCILTTMTGTASSTIALMVGVKIVMAAFAVGHGLRIEHSAGAAGLNNIALAIINGSANTQGIEMGDGATVFVSNVGYGRLIYNTGLQRFQVSLNGGAYLSLVTGVGSLSLQGAYDGGASVVVTAANPITIANAAAVTSGLLTLTDSTIATNANVGVTWTRNATPTGATVWTGKAISIQNTPTATNSFSDSSTGLITINHAPIAGAGVITDTSIGLSATITPLASSAVRGIVVTMGALTSAAGIGISCEMLGVNGVGVQAVHDGTAAVVGSVALFARNSTYSGGGIEAAYVLETVWNPTVTASATYSGIVGLFEFSPISSGGATTLSASGQIVAIIHAPTVAVGGTVTDGMTALGIAMTPLTASAIFGIVLTMGAFTNATGFAARFDWRGTAGTAAGNGIVNIEVGAATVLTGPLTGLEIDLTGTTPGAFAHIGQRILIPATTRASTALEAAFVISSTATRMRMIDCAVANTGALDALWYLRWGTATALTSAIVMLWLNGYSNVTGSGQQFIGAVITSSDGASSASTCLVCNYSTAAGTASGNGIININIGTATTFTGVLTGIECDLRTNLNAATAQTMTCYTAKLSANMSANASTGLAYTRTGTVTVTHSYTGNAISVSNTPTGPAGGLTLTETSTLVNIYHAPVAGAGTINDSTIGMYIDLQPAASGTPVMQGLVTRLGANATATSAGLSVVNATAAVQFPHLRLSDVASAAGVQIYVGTGAPAHATGVNNGDMYWRVDGGAGTSIYKRIAGVWTAIA